MEINQKSDIPIYQQIIDSFHRDIVGGTLPAGAKLPTVRALSDQTGVARGTVKHAYDLLAQMKLIEKIQGKGSFVSLPDQNPVGSKKEQALEAIDHLLDQMESLRFPLRDTRIFIELKLREREHAYGNIRVGTVDCSPEALSVIYEQVSALANVDAYEYLLQSVLDAPQKFDPGMDLLVTTPTHFEQLSAKLAPGQQLIRMVLSPSPATMLALARISPDVQAGILCASRRFAQIIERACDNYGLLQQKPRVALFGKPQETKRFILSIDQLILPQNYLRFASVQEQAILREHQSVSKPVVYQYKIERGSLLYLEEEIARIYQSNKEKL